MIVQVLEIALFYMKKLNLFFFCAKIFLGGYFGMLNREKILEGIMNRKSYVSFTPYFTNSMGTRRQLNLITYPRYSKSEIVRMLDTDGAINFMEESTTAIEEFVKSLKETPLWSTFSCELSYFIDSRGREELPSGRTTRRRYSKRHQLCHFRVFDYPRWKTALRQTNLRSRSR